jgi:hypothetical protein
MYQFPRCRDALAALRTHAQAKLYLAQAGGALPHGMPELAISDGVAKANVHVLICGSFS